MLKCQKLDVIKLNLLINNFKLKFRNFNKLLGINNIKSNLFIIKNNN